MAELRGIEPPARALGGHCSIQLSYSSIKYSIRIYLSICNYYCFTGENILHSLEFVFQGD